MADTLPTTEDLARDATVDLAVCDAAGKGPWDQIIEFGAELRESNGQRYCKDSKDIPQAYCYGPDSYTNIRFIALARTALPAWIKRAIAAEARLSRLETLCGELGTRSVSNAHNAEDAETLYECLLGLAEILKSIGENARRPAT